MCPPRPPLAPPPPPREQHPPSARPGSPPLTCSRGRARERPATRPGCVPGCCSLPRAFSGRGAPRVSEGVDGLGRPSPGGVAGSGRPAAGEGKLSPGPEPGSTLRGTPRARLRGCLVALSRSQLPSSLGGRSSPRETGVGYMGPSSGSSGPASLALGLRVVNLPMSLAAVEEARGARAAAAPAVAASITRRMPERALPAAPPLRRRRLAWKDLGTRRCGQRSPG